AAVRGATWPSRQQGGAAAACFRGDLAGSAIPRRGGADSGGPCADDGRRGAKASCAPLCNPTKRGRTRQAIVGSIACRSLDRRITLSSAVAQNMGKRFARRADIPLVGAALAGRIRADASGVALRSGESMIVAFDEMKGTDGGLRPAYGELFRWLSEVPSDVFDYRRPDAGGLFRRLGLHL